MWAKIPTGTIWHVIREDGNTICGVITTKENRKTIQELGWQISEEEKPSLVGKEILCERCSQEVFPEQAAKKLKTLRAKYKYMVGERFLDYLTKNSRRNSKFHKGN